MFLGEGSEKSVTCKLKTGSSVTISMRGMVNLRFSDLNRLSSELKNTLFLGLEAGGVKMR